jgi:hypothetical protein
MHRPLLRAVTAIAPASLMIPDVGHAGGTPAQVCAGATLKATGKAAGASVGCHAKAAQKASPPTRRVARRPTPSCADAFAKAAARGVRDRG